MKKIFIKSSAAVLVIIFISATLFFFDLKSYSTKNGAENKTFKVIFSIKSGQSLGLVAKNLEKNNLITSPIKFKILAKLMSMDKKIQAGEYKLVSTMTPMDILNAFVKGEVNLHKLTIPEGYSIKQIAEVLEKNNLCSKDEFIEKAFDMEMVESLNINGESLEGYLFPETYFFSKNPSPENIINTMANRFFSIYTNEFQKRAEEINFTDHEIITLASIIEKETGAAKERKLISSVFHNRLKKRMKLETDPTVIYGIKNFNGNITRKDLRKKTPYNTYIIRGLPPGPIANPGIESIKAALYPAKTEFLFFVSKKDGTHYFSRTLREHNKAVRKYQLGR